MSLDNELEEKMKKLSIYVFGLFYGLTPGLVQAHAQFTAHHHSDGEYWLSVLPEIVLVVLSLGAIRKLINHLKKTKSSVKVTSVRKRRYDDQS